MRLLILLLFAAGLTHCQSKPPLVKYSVALKDLQAGKFLPVVNRLSFVQGGTDSTSTQINILAPKDAHWSFLLSAGDNLPKPVPNENIQSFRWNDSQEKILTLNLNQLDATQRYRLDVVDENNQWLDSRFFRTFDLNHKNAKIAVISCTDDRLDDLQKKQWPLVWSQNPDLLLMIGDNVYVDIDRTQTVNSQLIWKRYVETRRTLELYKMQNLIPVLASWDDHDYGLNNSDRRFKYKDDSKKIFEAFFPQLQNQLIRQKGPGTSQWAQFGDSHFIFFDDRTFRSEKNAKDSTHFGIEQEKWFFQILQKNSGLFWLISGDQFFGAYHHFESYEGDHPTSFKNFLQKIKSYKKPVVFISGDRHLAEVMKIDQKELGYETYELTSSGLHAKVFPGSLAKEKPNPRSVFGQDGIYHFLILENIKKSNPYEFKASFINDKGQSFFSRELQMRQK